MAFGLKTETVFKELVGVFIGGFTFGGVCLRSRNWSGPAPETAQPAPCSLQVPGQKAISDAWVLTDGTDFGMGILLQKVEKK